MFETAPEYVGDTSTMESDGFTFRAEMHRDDDMGAPWKEHDGHGPVSEWTTREKAPGEILLSSDGVGGFRNRGHSRFYDFAEACRIARRDGWGFQDAGSARFYDFAEACRIARRDRWRFQPAPMTVLKNSGGKWHAWFGDGHAPGCNVGGYDDANAAISALYANHRATMTARQYAAEAARRDFERLKAWCDDEWHWCGIVVTASREGVELGSASLWGIESDAGEYLVEVCNELVDRATDEAREKLERLCCA